MPDDNSPETKENITTGRGAWDAVVVGIEAVRDILNDWRVMVTLLICLLLFMGRVAAPELGGMVESWIRAWKCMP